MDSQVFNIPDGRSVFDQRGSGEAAVELFRGCVYTQHTPRLLKPFFFFFFFFPAGFEPFWSVAVTCSAVMTHLWVRHDKYIGFKHWLNFLSLTLTHTHTHTHTSKCNKASTIAA